MSVEDAEGRPVEPSSVEHPPPEIPEDPNELRSLKRQAMPTSEAKAKPQVSPQQVKRPGGLSIASGPPMTKAKPSPTQGLKRTAEEGTGELETRITAEQAAVPAAAPDTGAQDLKGAALAVLKEVAMGNIKTLAEETYKRNGIEISFQEIADIASLSCEMAATDIAEVYSPKRFTALAQQCKLRPGFAVDLCETKGNGE